MLRYLASALLCVAGCSAPDTAVFTPGPRQPAVVGEAGAAPDAVDGEPGEGGSPVAASGAGGSSAGAVALAGRPVGGAGSPSAGTTSAAGMSGGTGGTPTDTGGAAGSSAGTIATGGAGGGGGSSGGAGAGGASTCSHPCLTDEQCVGPGFTSPTRNSSYDPVTKCTTFEATCYPTGQACVPEKCWHEATYCLP
jgi:hypothetical protein